MEVVFSSDKISLPINAFFSMRRRYIQYFTRLLFNCREAGKPEIDITAVSREGFTHAGGR